MRNLPWVVGSALAAVVVTVAVILKPIEAAQLLGAAVALAIFMGIPRHKVGSFALAAAITLTVLIPASEFSGTFRQGLSIGAAVMMGIGYVRSDIRRPTSKALWLLPAWLLILGLGDLTGDSAVKWLVYSALTIAAALLATRANAKPVFRWVVVLAVFETAIGTLQVLAGFKLPWAQITSISGNEILGPPWARASGTMGHALPLTFLLIVAFVILLRDSTWLPKAFRLATFTVLAGGVVLTGSRSGALVLAFFVLFAVGKKITLGRAIFGTLAAAIGLVIVVISGFFESQAFEKIMASGSIYHRQGALEAFGNLWNFQGTKEVMLGRGYSGVPAAFDLGLLQNDGFNTVDNQFIALMVTSGVLGGVTFLVLLLKAFKLGSSSERWVLLGGVGMFLIFDVLLWASTTVLLVVAIGFALSAERTTADAPVVDDTGVGNRKILQRV